MDFTLQARSIRKSFGGVEVLHGVDLEADAGSVLALLGENGAGKSTLVKIISGDYTPDSGEIAIGGEVRTALDPVSARELGIRMIFQEIVDAPTLTVAENISLGHLPSRGGIIDWRAVRRHARAVLTDFDVDIDPGTLVANLRIGERQVIEIARELTDRARCLILDEPTAALSEGEVQRLFTFIRRLRDRGVAIIYITHRLDEVPVIADRVQVLRDGNVVLNGDARTLTRAELVSAMVGRTISEVQRPESRPAESATTPLLRLVAASYRDEYRDVNLDVFPGEVVALYGKLGSGATEVAEAVYGLHRLTSGMVELNGKVAVFRDPSDAIKAGVGYLPADRQREGAFPVRSVAENLCAPSWLRLARFGAFITARREANVYGRWHDALRVRSTKGPGEPLGTLSGGNQQKVLLGRWLERRSRLLVLVEPTRGVDVGARQEIYRLIRSLAAQGVAVLISTSDYEEVVQVADRATIMARGQVVAELDGDSINTETLIAEGAG